MSRTTFIAVSENETGDYTDSPQHIVKLSMSPVSNRTKTAALVELQAQITAKFRSYLPRKDARLLIWQLDDAATPSLFVTGLIDRRSGKVTSHELVRWEDALRSQVAVQQDSQEATVTVSATLHFSWEDGHDFERSHYASTREIAEELVASECIDIDSANVSYTEWDDDYLMVNAAIHHEVSLDVPFDPTGCLTDEQRMYLQAAAGEAIHLELMCDNVVDVQLEAVGETQPVTA